MATAHEALRVEVADHGSGFDPEGTPTGSGLAGMSDRLQAIGGTVEIESGTGSGTVVRLDIPLSRTEPSL